MLLRRPILRWLVCLFAAVALANAARAANAANGKLVPIIFRPWHIDLPTIAPDGRHLAYVWRDNRSLRIVVFDTEATAPKSEFTLEESGTAQVLSLAWATSDCLVLATDTPAIHSIFLSGKRSHRLLDADRFATQSEDGRALRRPPRLVSLLADEPESVLVEGALPGFRGGQFDSVKLNLRTAAFKKVDGPEIEARVGSVIYDRQGRPRVWLRTNENPQRYRLRAPERGAGWKDLDALAGNKTTWAFHISPENFLGHRSVPLAFDYDPNVLYIASNIGRDTRGIYALDVRTMRRTELAVETDARDLVAGDRPAADDALIFDRSRRRLAGVRGAGPAGATHWLDPEIAQVQAELAKKLPGRGVQLIGWDDARAKFLAHVAHPGDPGRTVMFVRTSGRCVDFGRRASGLDPDEASSTEPFEFDTPQGVRLRGALTLPRAPRVTPPPIVVVFHDGPWRRVEPGFDREAQALADLGFAVVTLNYRGSDGFGERFRLALRAAPDTAPVADAIATLDWIAARHPFDRKRVAVLGEGYGGYLALRAAQLHPGTFRCAVAINAPLSLEQMRDAESAETAQARRVYDAQMKRYADAMLRPPPDDGEPRNLPPMPQRPPVDFEQEVARWFFNGDRQRFAAASITGQVESLTSPVLLANDSRSRVAPADAAKKLRDALTKRGRSAEFLEVPPAFSRGPGPARAQVVLKIGGFLNEHLYDYKVKVGEAVPKDG